jgi:hypothetical protein
MDSLRVPDGLPLFEDTPSQCLSDCVDDTLKCLMALNPEGSPHTPGARVAADIPMGACVVQVAPTEIDPDSPPHSECGDTLERLLDIDEERESSTGEDGLIVVCDSDEEGKGASVQSQFLLRSGDTPPHSPTEVATSPYPSQPPSPPRELKFVPRLHQDVQRKDSPDGEDEQAPQPVFSIEIDDRPPKKRCRTMRCFGNGLWPRGPPSVEDDETLRPSPDDEPADEDAAELWQRRLNAPGASSGASSEAGLAVPHSPGALRVFEDVRRFRLCSNGDCVLIVDERHIHEVLIVIRVGDVD